MPIIQPSSLPLHELALFAGAGGGILGGKLLGWKCVCAVEVEPAARGMLAARQDDGCLDPFPIWDDVRTFDGKPWRGLVDVVSGGFPCQDISAAGKGAGLSGERSGLWSEMSRIIGEVGPRYVIVENSPVLTSRGLGTVLGDLASMGYDARWGVLGAVHAGAPHKRERIWIVANRAEHGRGARRKGRPDPSDSRQPEQPLQDMAHSSRLQPGRAEQRTQRERAGQGGESIALADSNGKCGGTRRHGREHTTGPWTDDESARPTESPEPLPVTTSRGVGQWWESEPDVGRVAHGVAARVDRLRALGNGQVPAVVALAWKLLKR